MFAIGDCLSSRIHCLYTLYFGASLLLGSVTRHDGVFLQWPGIVCGRKFYLRMAHPNHFHPKDSPYVTLRLVDVQLIILN